MVGYPPADQRDWYIVRGFLRISGAAAMRANPDKGIPLLKAKPGVPHGGSRAPLITAGNAIIIVLLTAITFTRLGLRLFRRDLKWGADDYAIIVGVAAVLTWFGLAIAQVSYGGSGKHIWDLTYAELDWFIDVSWHEARNSHKRLTKFDYLAVGRQNHDILRGSRLGQNIHLSFQPSSYGADLQSLDDISHCHARPDLLIHHCCYFCPMLQVPR